jgi:trigger factor
MIRPSSRTKLGKKIDAMQVTETLVEGLKHEFQISVPASDLDA